MVFYIGIAAVGANLVTTLCSAFLNQLLLQETPNAFSSLVRRDAKRDHLAFRQCRPRKHDSRSVLFDTNCLRYIVEKAGNSVALQRNEHV